MVIHQDVTHTVEDDGGLCYDVEITPSGSLTAKVRVWGRVIIDGEVYEYDRDTVRVALKKVKD